jgi:hypothetical protein
MLHNRRRSSRVPVGFYVDQIVNDDAHRCFTTDLSALGIYMERLVEPLQRSSNVVQLEIQLPQITDTLWVKGEVIYDRFDSLFHGTAVHFTGMARMHQRLLRDWLRETERYQGQLMHQHPLRNSGRVKVVRPSAAAASHAA